MYINNNNIKGEFTQHIFINHWSEINISLVSIVIGHHQELIL